MPPYETEEKLVNFLDRLDEEAGAAKGDLDRRIVENLDIVRGKQWKGERSPYFLYNVIESALEDKHGKLSESKPRIKVLPTVDGMGAPAEVLTKTVQSIWDRRKVEYETEKIAMYGSISGVAFAGTPFNRHLNHGQGDIDFVIKDPRSCGVDVSITDATKTDLGEYVIIEDFVPLDILRSEYPGRGALVEPDEKVSGFSPIRPQTSRELLRAAYSRLMKRTKRDEEKYSVIPKAIIKEYYIQDRRKNINDSGVVPMVAHITTPAKSGVPFPGGRRIVRAGNIVLEDSFNPYWDGYYPIDMLSWKVDPETAWGSDEVQAVKRLQESVNRIGDAFTKNIILNSVIRIILDQGALSPTERNKLSNLAAEIIEKAPGRTFEYQVPPTLPIYIMDSVERFAEYIRQKIGATQPPTQKRVPSIITGPAIEGLQLMVETPIRTAARRIEEFYQRIGQKIISRIFQYYTSNRILHLVGPSEEWVQFEFVRKNLIVDAKGRPRSEEDLRKAFKDFYFAIEPGSSLAITRVQRVMAKMELLKLGLLHPVEVLKEAGFDNAEETLKKAQEAKQAGLFDAIQGDGRKDNRGDSNPLGNGLF